MLFLYQYVICIYKYIYMLQYILMDALYMRFKHHGLQYMDLRINQAHDLIKSLQN